MLEVPEDSRAQAAADGQPAAISFGFSRSTSTSVHQPGQTGGSQPSFGTEAGTAVSESNFAAPLFFGEDRKKQLAAVSTGCSKVAKEVGDLVAALRSTLGTASEQTANHLNVMQSTARELQQVSAAGVAGANELIERTIALSDALQNVNALSARVSALEQSMDKYELLASAILARQQP